MQTTSSFLSWPSLAPKPAPKPTASPGHQALQRSDPDRNARLALQVCRDRRHRQVLQRAVQLTAAGSSLKVAAPHTTGPELAELDCVQLLSLTVYAGLSFWGIRWVLKKLDPYADEKKQVHLAPAAQSWTEQCIFARAATPMCNLTLHSAGLSRQHALHLLQGGAKAKAAEAARRTKRKLQLSNFEEVCVDATVCTDQAGFKRACMGCVAARDHAANT